MNKIKILIVEDESIVAKELQYQLEDMGYSISAMASTGEDAILKAEECVPDLILMDIMLVGEIDGIEAVNKIHATYKIPVIYLTALTDDEILEKAKASDPSGYIVKPFNPETLKVTIEMALYKHKAEKEKEENRIKMLAVSKLATLGEVAAGVAHEINQPLTYINMTLQGTLEDFEEEKMDREHAISRLKKSCEQVDRIDQIISHLLTFGRADECEKKEVNISKVLDNILLLFVERMRKKNINVISSNEDVLPLIKGNENQLGQVFLNLIQNSIYAIEEKGNKSGKITVTIKQKDRKDEVQIKFSDDGQGIAPEHINKVFQPFFTAKPVGKGTGLGASIVYSIIRDHGGEIECKSKVDQGTTFFITLPTYDER